MPMTIANVEMAKAWEEEGVGWTRDADRYDASGARHWRRFLDAGLILPTDRVLDIGCGTGQSSRDAARLAASGAVHGVDISTQMLDDARRRAADEGLTNVTFEFADAQVHPFDEGSYEQDGHIRIDFGNDTPFLEEEAELNSVAARHMEENVRQLVELTAGVEKTSGATARLLWSELGESLAQRLAGRELSQNEWLQTFRGALAAGRELPAPPNGAPGPFALAEPDGVNALLTGAGFTDIACEAVDAPLYFGEDADDAWAFVSGQGVVRGLTQDLEAATKADALAALKQVLSDHATDDGVLLGAATWIITARVSR